MARVFPPLGEIDRLSPSLNVGERQVLDSLKTLDDGWTVYVQPKLGLDQPDFIVLHPSYGVTALEVKDWSVGCYRQELTGALQVREGEGWRRIDEAPRYQAHRYRDTIFSRCFADANTPSKDFAVVRAVVVLVRHTTTEARSLLEIPHTTAAELRVQVWGGDDLRRHPVLVLTGRNNPSRVNLRPENIDRLRRHLAEPEAISDQRSPLTLSAAAQNIERNTSNARMRRVRGAAGSGKSLGLAARAARLAKEGKDVLVVTYNTTLPHYLHDLAARRCREIDAPLNRITFTHLHGWCNRVCDDGRLAGFDAVGSMLPGMTDENDAAVDRATDVYKSGLGQRFDAVLVDEGQDFSLRWWNFLRRYVCKPDGEMLLVADPTQDIYDQRAWTDEARMVGAGFRGAWTEVDGSYRMPPDLIQVVADFVTAHVDGVIVPPLVPIDHPMQGGNYAPTVRRWVNLQRGETMGHRLGQEVVQLLRSNADLSPSDIVFLASSHKMGLEATRVIERAGHEVQHVFSNDTRERRKLKERFWASTPGVKGCTFHSFKGWESRAVVLPVSSSDNSHRMAYVGLTRVKGDPRHRSAFVTVVNNDLRLYPFEQQFMAS